MYTSLRGLLSFARCYYSQYCLRYISIQEKKKKKKTVLVLSIVLVFLLRLDPIPPIFCPISHIPDLVYTEIRLIFHFVYSALTVLRQTTCPLLYHSIRFVTGRLRLDSRPSHTKDFKIVQAALSLGAQD